MGEIGGHDCFTKRGDDLLWRERTQWRRLLFVLLNSLHGVGWFGAKTWQIGGKSDGSR